MALVLSSLQSSLEAQWLVPKDGSYPASVNASAERFATCVSTWFAAATAGPFPCSTALARKAQLASGAAAALSLKDAFGAGNALASAVALYFLGQLFGAGVANMPLAQAAAGSMLGAVFSDRSAEISSKAQQVATACNVLAISTIVIFPLPLPPAPVS